MSVPKSAQAYWQSVIQEAAKLILEDVRDLVEGIIDADGMVPFDIPVSKEQLIQYVNQNIADGTLATMAGIVSQPMAARQLTERKAAIQAIANRKLPSEFDTARRKVLTQSFVQQITGQ